MTDNLPALPDDFIASLKTGIVESRNSSTLAFSGKPLLRLSRDGKWIWGQENIYAEPDALWCINVMSLRHGWCCWVEGPAKNELRGEVMAPMTQNLPPQPAAINGVEFKPQFACDLRCVSGEDDGLETLYKGNSYGGLKMADSLKADIRKRLDIDPHHSCPVVRLSSAAYQHQRYGQIYNPVYEIVGWSDINGNMANTAVPVPPTVQTVQTVQTGQTSPQTSQTSQTSQFAKPAEPAELAKPAVGAPVRSRQAPPVPPATAVPPTSPAPTAAAHVGQRRRRPG